MRDTELDLERVVGLVLAATGVRRISLPPWRLEEAIQAGVSAEGPLAERLSLWVEERPWGPAVPGLETAVAALDRAGGLVWSDALRCYVVDEWWRRDTAGDLSTLDTASRKTVLRVAAELDRIEAAAPSGRDAA